MTALLAPPSRLRDLSERELELLALMAQGYSNSGIAAELYLSPKTVETHVRSIFAKLGLAPEGGAHRRVRAVLMYLGALAPQPTSATRAGGGSLS